MTSKSMLMILLCAETLFAGVWTPRQDHYYFRLSGFAFKARAVYDKDSKLGLLIGQIYGVRARSGAEAATIKSQSQFSLNPIDRSL